MKMWEKICIRHESPKIPLYHLQLNDVELSCLLKVVLEFVEMVGGQNVLRGTEIHPVFSPSRARASSKMNFPSVTESKNYSRFSPTSATRDKIIIIHNDVLFRRVCCSFFFNFHIVLRGILQESTRQYNNKAFKKNKNEFSGGLRVFLTVGLLVFKLAKKFRAQIFLVKCV